MKAIINRIKRHTDGFMSLRMERRIQNGRTYRYMLWLSPPEQSQGRHHIAKRIKAARRNLQQAIQERTKWKH